MFFNDFGWILEAPGPTKIKKKRFLNACSFEGGFWDGFGRILKGFWMGSGQILKLFGRILGR